MDELALTISLCQNALNQFLPIVGLKVALLIQTENSNGEWCLLQFFDEFRRATHVCSGFKSMSISTFQLSPAVRVPNMHWGSCNVYCWKVTTTQSHHSAKQSQHINSVSHCKSGSGSKMTNKHSAKTILVKHVWHAHGWRPFRIALS